ncbi:MAG TPA: rRNA maturation RNase YbeY, partial [Methanocorpusculum sp.]|nr:rRNA maturation RNase YbeY [Methanocorpusculum sp.]
ILIAMIRFFTENISFDFKPKAFTKRWLKSVALAEDRTIGDISVIFCSDDYLLDINRKFIGHDYYTDIITFDYCEDKRLSGDLFISVDSVRDNSQHFNTGFEEELNRVIVHGVLHLIGYDDHTEEDQKMMRSKENTYLECRANMI